MSIVKNYKRKNRYSMIDNTGVLDESLSWKAKGLLWYILSKPDDWQVKMADLIKRSTDGRDSTRSAFAELEANKYAIQVRGHDEKGFFCWNTIVFDSPEAFDEWADTEEGRAVVSAKKATKPQPVNAPSTDGSSVNGQASDGQPEVIYITDSTNIESTNIEEEKGADEFFTIAPSSQIQENSFPAQTENPRIQETPNPQSPLSPSAPENIGKAIAPSAAVSKQAERYIQFEKRFSQQKPQNRHAPQSVIDAGYAEWHNGKHPNDWRKSLIDVCIQRKKKRGDVATVGAATDFIFNTIKDCVALGFWGKFQELVDQALVLESQEAIAAQQRQAEQQRFEQPPEDDGERVDIDKIRAELKRKQLLRKTQAA